MVRSLPSSSLLRAGVSDVILKVPVSSPSGEADGGAPGQQNKAEVRTATTALNCTTLSCKSYLMGLSSFFHACPGLLPPFFSGPSPLPYFPLPSFLPPPLPSHVRRSRRQICAF